MRTYAFNRFGQLTAMIESSIIGEIAQDDPGTTFLSLMQHSLLLVSFPSSHRWPGHRGHRGNLKLGRLWESPGANRQSKGETCWSDRMARMTARRSIAPCKSFSNNIISSPIGVQSRVWSRITVRLLLYCT